MTATNQEIGIRPNQTAEHVDNWKYILGFCKPDGIPVDIDLSDDRQFQFLLDERGGDKYLRTYFPHYHRTLHASRQRILDTKTSNAPSLPTHPTLLELSANGDDVSSNWYDLVQIASFIAQRIPNSNSYVIQSTALVSFVDGMQLMNATLTIGNPNTGELIAQTNISQVFDQAYNTTVMTTGTTSSLDGVEASLTIDGVPYSTSIPIHKIARTELLDKIDPSSPIVVTNPIHKATVPNIGFIKVCMGRNSSDCDYLYAAQPGGKPPIPMIDVSGSVTYAGTITPPSSDSTKFGTYFFVKNRNGGAAQFFSGGDAYKNFTLSPDGHTISWDFPPATFEKAPWNQGDSVDLNLTVSVGVNSATRNTDFQITSLSGVIANPSVAKIDVLKFVWGCLGADSLIKLKDGSYKQIDFLRRGDEVVVNQHGVCAPVIDIVTGEEDKPCLRITTVNGRSLLVTDGHPVSRQDGFCPAGELHPGDMIVTETGYESVLEVTSEWYEGIVYNLKLGTAGNSSEGATHYANGILVGDANMQGYLLEKHQQMARKPRTIDELPAEWRFDAENAARLREGKELISAAR